MRCNGKSTIRHALLSRIRLHLDDLGFAYRCLGTIRH